MEVHAPPSSQELETTERQDALLKDEPTLRREVADLPDSVIREEDAACWGSFWNAFVGTPSYAASEGWSTVERRRVNRDVAAEPPCCPGFRRLDRSRPP